MILISQLFFAVLIIAVLSAMYSALLGWLRTPVRRSESSLRRVTAVARLASFTRPRNFLSTHAYYDS